MKKIIAILMCILLIFCLVGCGEGPSHMRYAEHNVVRIVSEHFEADIVEDLGGDCYIIRDKHTNVLYLVAGGGGDSVAMTPIYNTDGTLKLYTE